MVLEEVLGIETVEKDVQFSQFQNDLLNDELDLIPSIYDTSITNKEINASSTYLFDRLYAYTKDGFTFENYYDINSIRIGVANNYSHVTEKEIEELADMGVYIGVKKYPIMSIAVEAYKNGEIDCIVENIVQG